MIRIIACDEDAASCAGENPLNTVIKIFYLNNAQFYSAVTNK